MIAGISDKATFARLRSEGTCVRLGELTIRHLPADDATTPARVAYAIPRRVGNAVTRNRLRRRIRGVIEEMRANDTTILAGDTVFGADRAASELGYEELRSNITELIGRLEGCERSRR